MFLPLQPLESFYTATISETAAAIKQAMRPEIPKGTVTSASTLWLDFHGRVVGYLADAFDRAIGDEPDPTPPTKPPSLDDAATVASGDKVESIATETDATDRPSASIAPSDDAGGKQQPEDDALDAADEEPQLKDGEQLIEAFDWRTIDPLLQPGATIWNLDRTTKLEILDRVDRKVWIKENDRRSNTPLHLSPTFPPFPVVVTPAPEKNYDEMALWKGVVLRQKSGVKVRVVSAMRSMLRVLNLKTEREYMLPMSVIDGFEFVEGASEPYRPPQDDTAATIDEIKTIMGRHDMPGFMALRRRVGDNRMKDLQRRLPNEYRSTFKTLMALDPAMSIAA
ncbi:hypothetical protein CKA32_007046 [Geitlerinema sp. FC II]|nr:hypothetical protein CKA32_007046 [Geitlerinema sp. FC II]